MDVISRGSGRMNAQWIKWLKSSPTAGLPGGLWDPTVLAMSPSTRLTSGFVQKLLIADRNKICACLGILFILLRYRSEISATLHAYTLKVIHQEEGRFDRKLLIFLNYIPPVSYDTKQHLQLESVVNSLEISKYILYRDRHALEMRNAYNILVGKSEEKKSLGRLTH
jgi:hypothetical protein